MHQVYRVSIVVPAYREEGNVGILYKKIQEAMMSCSVKYNFNVFFVDDGSDDNTWDQITMICRKNIWVHGVRLSRNFGHQAALTAGFDLADGDVIISLDADLQDPPELIPLMLKKWESGDEVVYARHTNRHDSWPKKWTAIVYYRFLSYISHPKMPANVGDFRLIDKKVLEAFRTLREKDRYIRGMFFWLGFKTGFVDFDRPERKFGTTWYSLKKMFKLANDGIFGFSDFPVKIPAIIGGILFLLSLAIGGCILTVDVNHFLSECFFFLFLVVMSLQFFCLWIIGEYVARIYNESRERPIYVAAEKLP